MHHKVIHNFKGIIDSTLREGQQFNGARFSLNQQQQIVRLLGSIGVDRIEVGNPINPSIRKEIVQLDKIGNHVPFLAHIRNRLEDVTAAIETGVAGVNILCTVDEDRLRHMQLSREEYLDTLEAVVRQAKQNNLETRVSVENTFGTDPQKVLAVHAHAQDLGVDRIGIADTRGIAMNWQVARRIRRTRKRIATDIEVHFHNDLGQATGNAFSALGSGANWVDTTLLGIGERSGITALSTLLCGLFTIDSSIGTRYRMHRLTDAEGAIAKMVKRPVPFNLITSEENGFSHKAGIHLHALVHFGPHKYEPFAPKTIGNRRNMIVYTDISGRTTNAQLKQFYEQHGQD